MSSKRARIGSRLCAIAALAAFAATFSGCGTSDGYAGPEDVFRYNVFVANSGDGTVSSIQWTIFSDLLTPVAVYPAGTSPETVRMHPSGQWVYYLDSANGAASQGTIGGFAITPATGVLGALSSMPAPALSDPRGMTIDALGENLYAASYTDGKLAWYQIDPTSGAVTGPTLIAVPGGYPTDVALNPEGTLLYVTGYQSNDIQIFTVASNGSPTYSSSVYCGNPASPSTAMFPTSVRVSPTTGQVFVANTAPGLVTMFSASSSTLTYQASATVTSLVGTNDALSVRPDGAILYALDTSAGLEAFSIGPTSLSLLSTTSMGDTPGGVFSEAFDNTVFTAVAGSTDSLSLFSASTGSTSFTSLGTVGVGSTPSSIVASKVRTGW
jgi:DNA-binding beta-propeller fold protein YncE